MGKVAGQVARDLAVYRAWVDGARQLDLAEQYQVTQPAISAAIGRVLAQLPPPDREAEIRRSLDLVDDLVCVFAPRARTGDPSASREVRGLLMLRARYAGIDRREVLVEHGGTVQVQVQVEPPEVVVSRILAKQLPARDSGDIVEGELVGEEK